VISSRISKAKATTCDFIEYFLLFLMTDFALQKLKEQQELGTLLVLAVNDSLCSLD
jgi:hypothetical protein